VPSKHLRLTQPMYTEQQLKAYNEARLLKAAIRRNADIIAVLLDINTQKQLIACEEGREHAMREIRTLEATGAECIGAAIRTGAI
jgi:hypothetical protein